MSESNKLATAAETGAIITRSFLMLQLLDRADRFAATSAPVLITGESGTGKELLAQRIHAHSPFRSGPLVSVNCAAFSESVVESELFGHEAGAFTGATQQRKGRFELAANGSIFLDEMGELPLTVQAKLLRVLEQGDFQRVGGTTTHQLTARVIVATNRDLQQEIADRRFREDLYYRICPLELKSPPLRERPGDIALLVDHFILQFQQQGQGIADRVSASVLRQLQDYPWPGNIRELRNVLMRACLLTRESVIQSVDLPNPDVPVLAFPASSGQRFDRLPLTEIERHIILDRLDQHGGHQSQTAKSLGITPRTLRNKLNEYRVRKAG